MIFTSKYHLQHSISQSARRIQVVDMATSPPANGRIQAMCIAQFKTQINDNLYGTFLKGKVHHCMTFRIVSASKAIFDKQQQNETSIEKDFHLRG